MTPQIIDESDVRRRIISDDPDINAIPDHEREAIDRYLEQQNKTNLNASTIVWMILGIMAFTFSDFPTVVASDPRVNGPYLRAGGLFVGVNIIIGIYFVLYLSYVRGYKDWSAHAHPAAIPIATLCGCIGIVLLNIAFWPVWGMFTLPILFCMGMGMFMLASLSPF